MRSMERVSETPASVAFGRFRILPGRRELLAGGQPIKLGGRAFDVLMALIEARGKVVGKRPLMARVWPNQIVIPQPFDYPLQRICAGSVPSRAADRGSQYRRVLGDDTHGPCGAGRAAFLAARCTLFPGYP